MTIVRSPATPQQQAGWCLPPVTGNDWRQLQVPGVDHWVATKPLSVVIPAYDSHATLPLALASVAVQGYPRHLLEVVVVDDGSTPPLAPEVHGLEQVRIHRLEREDGFGSGRARRVGADVADGEIIVFLDSDMVLEPHALAGHARWHHAYAAAVTLGRREHADFDGVVAEDLLRMRVPADLLTVVGERERWSVDYILRKVERTNGLTLDTTDVFRIAAGGNLGVSAAFYREVGGFPALGLRGIEDTLFGYRCYNAGALFVYDDVAAGWHVGRSFFQGAQAEQAKRNRAGRLANHIPVEAYRPSKAGRSYVVPAVRVHVSQSGAADDDVVATVDSVLASRFHDLQVVVEVDDPDEAVMRRIVDHFAGDARVSVGREAVGLERAEQEGVAVQVVLPAPALLGPDTLDLLLKELDRGPYGALHVTIPGAAQVRVFDVVRTRAHGRARRTAGWADPMAAIGALFGERWLPGSAFGVTAGAPPASAPAAATPAPEEPATPSPTAIPADELATMLGAVICRELPATGVVAVVTKGDDRFLVDLLGDRRGGHFPQTPQGIWAGYHPADGRQALTELDDLRDLGFTHLAIPAPSLWWLDYYTELRDRLAPGGVFLDPEVGAIFTLPPAVPAEVSAPAGERRLGWFPRRRRQGLEVLRARSTR
jgi:glycosyltransferase involved in cell wall biosynthesis